LYETRVAILSTRIEMSIRSNSGREGSWKSLEKEGVGDKKEETELRRGEEIKDGEIRYRK